MKKIHKLALAVFTAVIILSINDIYAQGGAAINSNGATADPSAMLDVSSTTRGVLVPRMTEAQKSSISAPATGLLIYQTDNVVGFWYYDGTTWVQSIGPAGATGPTGADGATGATGVTGLLPNGSSAGNTPYWDGSQWVVNSSNIHNNGGSIGIGTTTPDGSAKLDIASTTQGVLTPRMTESEKNLIGSPATGLLIYQTDGTPGFYYYNGTAWTAVSGGSSGADPTLLYTIDGF